MKIAVIGAGGVGGYFGARLAAAGEEVAFVARGPHLEAMRRTGLQIHSALGNLTLSPVRATADPATVGPVDLVMIAVKLYSTDEALDAVPPLIGPATAIVSWQNGVEAVDVLSRRFGAPRVLGGVARIAAAIEQPGVIRHQGTMARLTFGEADGARSPRAVALLEACQRAGIEAELTDDFERAIWEKFVFLVGVSGLTALTRQPMGPVRSHPATRSLLRDVMAEATAVARARGLELPDDMVERQMRFCDGLPGDLVSSLLGDVQRGNRLEVEWLAGAVTRMGGEAGVQTPLNRAIHAALVLHAQGTAR